MTSAKLVGPGLKGVTDKYEKEWLIKWIRNSQELIASGDERAIKIYEEYNRTAMSSFYFSDEEFSDDESSDEDSELDDDELTSGVRFLSTLFLAITLLAPTFLFT